ncbi:hypothetical protein CLF_101296 [Clonorchis sinensis]|uniref:ZSWIM1/3 RNaseH-like domain-containing protein n=1 Tax=Clonorchis sinensis TaxID=79923 RepID=G7Y5F6_CLOSI|nr:hypothetical protein CLF_101296 [Clonorchis sinensis]
MPSVLAKLRETGRVLVWQSEEGHYSHTCFSRWQQIALFRRFPDVVNVDETHATNRLGYKLYTFLITDGMGTGRPVMYAFVENEQFASMRKLFGLFKEMMGEQYPVRFRQDLQLLRRTNPRFVSYLTVRWLYITREWAVHAQSGMFHFGNVTNNRLENAEGRLKDRVHHADTLEHAIKKMSRHAEWLMREFEMHTSYHCDRRQILEGDGYVLNVVCRMTMYACCLVLRHLGPRPPRLPYDSVGTNEVRSRYVAAVHTFFPFLEIKDVPLTLVPKPPPTACDVLRKQTNRLMDKLQGLEPRKATASFKQLIAHGLILLRQGSNSATGGLPSMVEDIAPQPRWRSRDTDLGFCVLCDRPTTTNDRWCATDRVSYHADCYDGEPCPLCGGALQTCPSGGSTE